MTVDAFSLDCCPRCGAPDIVARATQVECLHCKEVMRLAELVACPRCGDVLPSATASCARCAPPRDAGHGAAAGAKGVGGWLLALAVYLAAVGPLLFLRDVVGLVASAGEAMFAPGLRAFTLTTLGIDAAITATLAAAGVQILALRPRAIHFCRRALLLAPAAAAADLMAAWLLLDADTFQRVLPAAAFGSARLGLVALAWLGYLQSSRRVRETFPG